MPVVRLSRIPSGVPGFDQLTDGGFEKGSTNIISGTPGTGKTTFAMQFLVEGARKGEKGLYLSLSEPVERIVLHSKAYFPDLDDLIAKQKLVVAEYPRQFTQQVGEPAARVSRLLDQTKFLMDKAGGKLDRIAVDSISLLSYRYESAQAQRNELDYLFQFLQKQDVTSMMVLERSEWNNVYSFEDFLGDSVVVLQDIIKDFDRKRGILVAKMRGARIDRTVRPYNITEKGIYVYPDSQII